MPAPIELIATLFTALCIAMTARFAHGAPLPKEIQQSVDDVAENHELLSDEKILAKVGELSALAKKDSTNDEYDGQKARLLFFLAKNDKDKEARIKKYHTAIAEADLAIQINSRSISGNFWKAAALGKQGLDKGVLNALGNAGPIKHCLEMVLGQDEQYEKGAAHLTMGRLYYELPGWPLSFGNNKKALEHLTKAYEAAPKEPSNNVYYAQMLIKNGRSSEAGKYLDYVLNFPTKAEHKVEMKEYLDLAKELKDDL